MADPRASTRPLFPDLPVPVAEGHGRIRPRARLLRTIGAELISSEVVAVVELVRNSYDADATEVDLVFQSPEEPATASLGIRDNGHGMSRSILLGPWLEPATDHKSGENTSGTGGERSPRGRRRLGSKGVGRFAAQRLGSSLELRTRAAGMETELTALFDWRALEQDKYLDQVRVPWREGLPEHIDGSGTHLHITRLRDHWSPDRFERLRLGLSRLVSPTMREQFEIRLTINGVSELIGPALGADAAMYSISGSVDGDGHCSITYRDVNDDSEEWERTVYWPPETVQQCGPFSFKISAWDLDREPLKHFLDKTDSKAGLRDFRRILREHSGISLYRDGFRILPYGEPDNDWLRLDQRRINNPTMRLSNNQVLGTIQLGADSNPNLQDQTNREGLVTNEAYGHLAEVVRELLAFLEVRRFAARRAMDIDWTRRTTSLPELAGNEGERQLELLVSKLGSGRDGNAAEELRAQIREFRASTADAVRHYAGLASVGQMSGLVFRQLDQPLRQIRSDLSLVLADLEAGVMDEDDVDDVRVSVERALQNLATMEKRMRTLDPLAIGGRGRRVSRQRVAEVLPIVITTFESELHKRGVVLELIAESDAELRINREVCQQVAAGLVENAIWFASQGDKPTPTVTVRVTDTGFEVQNNGPPIEPKHRPSIFDAHFTTRDDAHGMGLTLARDLIRTIGGRIRLKDSKNVTFAVELPRDEA